MIGKKNMGFYYLMTALDFERLFVGIGGWAALNGLNGKQKV